MGDTQEKNILRSLGHLEGSIEQYQKNTDEKLNALFELLKQNNQSHEAIKESVDKVKVSVDTQVKKIENRVLKLETDKKIVAKLAAVVSFLSTAIFTGLIAIGSRVVSEWMLAK